MTYMSVSRCLSVRPKKTFLWKWQGRRTVLKMIEKAAKDKLWNTFRKPRKLSRNTTLKKWKKLRLPGGKKRKKKWGLNQDLYSRSAVTNQWSHRLRCWTWSEVAQSGASRYPSAPPPSLLWLLFQHPFHLWPPLLSTTAVKMLISLLLQHTVTRLTTRNWTDMHLSSLQTLRSYPWHLLFPLW